MNLKKSIIVLAFSLTIVMIIYLAFILIRDLNPEKEITRDISRSLLNIL